MHRGKLRQFVFYFVLFFVLINGTGEILSRTILTRFLSSLDNPLVNLGYGPAELQFAAFSRYVKAEEAPNCLFFGSSLVQTDLDPTLFENAYNQQQRATQLRCYNFGLDGSTISSSSSAAFMVMKTVKPSYLFMGISPDQFYAKATDANNAELAETRFADSGYTQYSLGKFNLDGWLLANSYFYRALPRIMGRMFPPSASPKKARIRPELPRTFTQDGYGPLLGYRDTSPIFNPDDNGASERSVSEENYAALQKLIDEAHRGTFTLVLIEMPVFSQAESDRKTLREVAAYAQQRGIPVLSNEALSSLPAAAFADNAHMHITGSIIFSQFLGTQLGQLAAQGAFADVNNPGWAPILKDWPKPPQLSTLGLTERRYSTYLHSLDQAQIVPPDAVIYNPSSVVVDKTFFQSTLGYEADWQDSLGDQQRMKIFQLMNMLGRMRYAGELGLSADRLKQLETWRTTLEPSILLSNGIQHVLCRQELANPSTEHCPPGIAKNPDYVLLGSWDYLPMDEKYTLYQVGQLL